jgi:uncharacterized protein
MPDVEESMRNLVDHLVDRVQGVIGAQVSSTDGFALMSRLPDSSEIDPSALAAMSAATLGLANRLVQLTGSHPANVSIHRSDDGQVLVFGIAGVAALTMLTESTADLEQLQIVGREVGTGLQRLFRGAATA